jgi:hypothetical protein
MSRPNLRWIDFEAAIAGGSNGDLPGAGGAGWMDQQKEERNA